MDADDVKWKGIVKVQRQVFPPPGEETMLLIYNEDRSIIQEDSYKTEDIECLFAGSKDAHKSFHNATLHDNGHLELHGFAEWQGW